MVTVDDLTPSQLPAYRANDPRTLILGGPGTGKTAVALLIARRIIEEEPAESSKRVLFLTFSRSATSELLSRAPHVLAGPLGGRIDISTFHAFALTMLQAFRRFAGGSKQPVEILTREQEKLGLAPEGAITFDDVIPSFLALLELAPWLKDELQGRYAAILCDECQDTGRAAAAIVDELSAHCRLVCLADADQVIFDFADDSITQRITAFQASGAVTVDLGYDSRRDPSNVIPRAASAIRRRLFDHPDIEAACSSKRLNLRRFRPDQEPFEALELLARSALQNGAHDIGVFFATNHLVNEFAEVMRRANLPHEIVGLSGAAGEAQIATATLARCALGDADWAEFLVDLGVFVAACYRGKPPLLAVQLVGHAPLDTGIAAALEEERSGLEALAGKSLGEFLAAATSLWSRRFVGRPTLIWEQGLLDLRGQTITWHKRLLDRAMAEGLRQLAARRRSSGYVDDLPSRRAPIRIMNAYQVKGREMDDVLLVHLPGDSDEWDPIGMARLSRVHYVALSRARRRATIVLPPAPKPFFAPYVQICA